MSGRWLRSTRRCAVIRPGRPPGGGLAFDREDGCYVESTVYLDVDPGCRIAREEIFGPVLAVVRAGDLDEALAIASASEYGMSASVFTRDVRGGAHFARRKQAGVVHVNKEMARAELQVPSAA